VIVGKSSGRPWKGRDLILSAKADPFWVLGALVHVTKWSHVFLICNTLFRGNFAATSKEVNLKVLLAHGRTVRLYFQLEIIKENIIIIAIPVTFQVGVFRSDLRSEIVTAFLS